MGIKTGMSAYEAYKRCPYVCMLQVDYASYTAISTQVHHIRSIFTSNERTQWMSISWMQVSF